MRSSSLLLWLRISKMRQSFIFLLFLSFCILQTTACVAQDRLENTITAPSSHRQEGERAVNSILDAYRNKSPAELEILISDDFIPNKYEFLNSVDRKFVNKTILNIEYNIEKALLSKDTFSIEFDWDRTFVHKDNSVQTKDSGTTTFIFIKNNNGWRLYKIIGADIF